MNNLEVITPGGNILVENKGPIDYPGIFISVGNSLVGVLEYNPDTNKMQLCVYEDIYSEEPTEIISFDSL